MQVSSRRFGDVRVGFAWTGIAQMAGMAAGIVLARSVAPAERGEIAAALAFLTILGYALDFGLPVAVPYFLRHGADVLELERLAFRHSFAVAPAGALVGIAVAWMVGFDLGGNRPLALILGVAAYVMADVWGRSIIEGLKSGPTLDRYFRFRSLAPALLPALYVAAALVVAHTSLDAVLLFAAAYVSASVLTTALAVSVVTKTHKTAGTAIDSSEVYRYGLQAQLGAARPAETLRLDVLAAAVAGPTVAGIYVVALAFPAGARGLVSAVLATLWRRGGAEPTHRRALILGIAFAAAGSATAAVLLTVPVFGGEYNDARSVGVVLSLVVAVQGLRGVILERWRITGHAARSSLHEATMVGWWVLVSLMLAATDADIDALGLACIALAGSTLSCLVVVILRQRTAQ